MITKRREEFLKHRVWTSHRGIRWRKM